MEQLFAFVVNHWLLWSGFIIVLFLLISYEFSARYGGAEKISPQQTVRLMNQGNTLILDIRDQDRFEQGHIQGAVNIELKTLRDQLKKIQSHQQKPVIIVDDMGVTAAQAAKCLIENKFEQCHVLHGGTQGWVDASLPLIKGGKPSKAKLKAQAKAAKLEKMK